MPRRDCFPDGFSPSSKNLTSKFIDTKEPRQRTSQPIICPDWKNPYENVNDPKEINESFPLETLNMVTFRGDSRTPWFADFANYHAGRFIVKGINMELLTVSPPLYHPTNKWGKWKYQNRGLKRILERTIGSGYQQKDKKTSQNDKTEHGMEKTVQNQGQSPKMPKSESKVKPEPELKNTIGCNLNPSDGPGTGKAHQYNYEGCEDQWASINFNSHLCCN
ncbi:hypothetical protein Tco_0768229 [Tanacetum coccineum]